MDAETNMPKYTVVPGQRLYDLSLLEEMDDDGYVIEMLNILLTETPQDLAEMKEGVLAGDYDILCKRAHKLKSSAGIILANQFVSLLDTIEIMGKKGAGSAELTTMIDSAGYLFNAIEKQMKIDLAKLT